MIKVIFYNGKPQVGKSFLTMRVAQYLKDRFNEQVLLIDCTENKGLLEMRKKELNLFPGLDPKDIVELKSHSSYEDYKESEKSYIDAGYNIVLFDVENIKEEDLNYIMQSNYVFVVSDFKTSEDKDFKLDRMFYLKLNEAKVSNLFPLQQVKVISNMTDSSYSIDELDIDIDILETKIPYNQKDFGNISTIGRLSQSGNRNFKGLVNEIYHTIKNLDTIEVL